MIISSLNISELCVKSMEIIKSGKITENPKSQNNHTKKEEDNLRKSLKIKKIKILKLKYLRGKLLLVSPRWNPIRIFRSSSESLESH